MNDKLNIQDIVNILAAKHGMDKKDADVFVREFFLLIEQTLGSDNYVKIKGLGTFKLIEVGSRESVNVNTGDRFKIDGHTKISFTPDTALRDLINKPFAHFETVILNENTVLEDTVLEDNDDEDGESKNDIKVSEEVQSVDTDPVNEDAVSEAPAVSEEIPEEREEAPVEQGEVDKVIPIENEQEYLTESPKAEKLSTEEIIIQELPEAEKEVHNAELTTAVVPTGMGKEKGKREKDDKVPVSYLVAIIVVVLLLCGGALTYVYYPEVFLFAGKNQVADTKMTGNTAVQNSLLDTIEKVKVDTVVKTVSAKQKEVNTSTKEQTNTVKNMAVTNVSQAAVPVKPDSVNYTIVGTKTIYTIKEGETLTRVSLRFYGTKDLWPYIVKHNRDVIKNPNHVPYGTTLKIPELRRK